MRPELLVLLTVWIVPSVDCADKCTQVTDNDMPPCVCETDEHKNIDLRSLANTKGEPAFKDIKGADSATYSYNPCYAFTEGKCEDVAGCQNSDGSRPIGMQEKAEFKNDESGVSIHYGGGNEERKMVVRLNCTKGLSKAELTFIGELSRNEYTFVLKTECACPGVCGSGGGGGGGGGGSGGSHHSSSSKIGVVGLVIISIFVILLTVYFVAGMIIMRVKYDKTGTDIIPNKTFWINLPSLVKDGCIFTFTPCTKYCRNRCRGGYSNI